MLTLNNVATGYGKKQVLYGVSFKVNKKDMVLLAGGNGSGKSTLMKVVFGILPKWEGEILFDEWGDISGFETKSLIGKGILYIPQKKNLFEGFTVKENLEMAGISIPKGLLNIRIEKSMSIFLALSEKLNRKAMFLSGGEKQLLTLAMASLHEPKLIMLDEPFTGLSPTHIDEMIKHFKRLNEQDGVTFLIAEHNIDKCRSFANKVIGLKVGEFYSKYEIGSEFNPDILRDVYL